MTEDEMDELFEMFFIDLFQRIEANENIEPEKLLALFACALSPYMDKTRDRIH